MCVEGTLVTGILQQLSGGDYPESFSRKSLRLNCLARVTEQLITRSPPLPREPLECLLRRAAAHRTERAEQHWARVWPKDCRDSSGIGPAHVRRQHSAIRRVD